MKIIFFNMLMLFLATLSLHAHAQSDDWQQDVLSLSKLSTETDKGCDKIFRILWHWSKNDNLEARRTLVAYMTVFKGPYMQLPAPSLDDISRHRHYAIMAIHAIDDDLEEKAFENFRGLYIDFKGTKSDSTLDRCFQETRSAKCTEKAIEDNLIPSFEAFASEIDLFSNAGITATCLGVQEPKYLEK